MRGEWVTTRLGSLLLEGIRVDNTDVRLEVTDGGTS